MPLKIRACARELIRRGHDLRLQNGDPGERPDFEWLEAQEVLDYEAGITSRGKRVLREVKKLRAAEPAGVCCTLCYSYTTDVVELNVGLARNVVVCGRCQDRIREAAK